MKTTPDVVEQLVQAEKKAVELFDRLVELELIVPGITEKELNTAIYDLAEQAFGIRKFWHKRIVRAGKNTLLPYRENPPDLKLREEEILFLDFGPVFDEWEADLGRTYVIGNNPLMHQLKSDVETVWSAGQAYFREHVETITGSELYAFTQELAHEKGWEFGNVHAGHLIGKFPHEKVHPEEVWNYIHPDNKDQLSSSDKNGLPRYWIYEVHLVNREEQIGAFFEQLLLP